MTYPGDWIQADDYTTAGGDPYAVGGPTIPRWGFAEQVVAGLVAPDADTMRNMQRTVNSGVTLVPSRPSTEAPGSGGPDNPRGVVEFGVAYDTNPTTLSSTYRAAMDFLPMVISPYSNGLANWFPDLSLTRPPGVIGYEWHDGTLGGTKVADPQACAAELTITNTPVDDSTGADVPVTSGFISTLIACEGVEYRSDTLGTFLSSGQVDWIESWAGPSGTVADELEAGITAGTDLALDLTGHMDDLGRVTLSQRMKFDDPYAPLVPANVTPPGDPRGIVYGYDFSPSILWTLRPPVFRWIYAGDPPVTVTPPCRLYPRDDELSNTPRLYPPPRTWQSGLLTGPY